MTGPLVVALPPGGPPEGYLDAALDRARALGAGVTAVYVVDSVWSRFIDTDWLSTGASRAVFRRYMDDALRAEAGSMVARIETLASVHGVPFRALVVEGDPVKEFIAAMTSLGASEAFVPAAMTAALKRPSCPVTVYSCQVA